MPITSLLLTGTGITPAEMEGLSDVATANPDTFEANVQGYNGPLAGYTPNVDLQVQINEPWSAPKSTVVPLILAELD